MAPKAGKAKPKAKGDKKKKEEKGALQNSPTLHNLKFRISHLLNSKFSR
jgi:hypothetical protein